MTPAEQLAIARARLNSLAKRAEASTLLIDMLQGQLRRQQIELAAATDALKAAAPVAAPSLLPPQTPA